MPLAGTEAVLGKAIADAIKAIRPDNDAPVTDNQLELIWTAASKEIIDHFVANTVVNTATTGTANGVTSGPSAAPTTGVGVGTIG